MRKLLYYFCFLVIGAPALFHLSFMIISFFDPPPLSVWYRYLILWDKLSLNFISPIPPIIKQMVPKILNLIVTYIMIFSVLRRISLLRLSTNLPISFRGFPYGLAWISFVGFVLAIIGYGIFFIAGVKGTSAPAAMLLIPTILLTPWAFLITEILSFKTISNEK